MKEVGAMLRQQQNKANDDTKNPRILLNFREFTRKRGNTNFTERRQNCGWSGATTSAQQTKRTVTQKTLKPVEFSQKRNTKTRSNSRRNCGWSDASTATQERENRNANNRDEKYADRLEMSVRKLHQAIIRTYFGILG
jgi:hypothetical protein